MKKLVLIHLLFFFSFPIFAQQAKVKRVVLDWGFFKNERPQNAEHEALTWYRLSYKYRVFDGGTDKVNVQFDVSLVMDSVKSYFQTNKRTNGEKLLKHEQGHADIGIIYAEKLKKTFSETVFLKKNYQETVKAIYDKIFAEMIAENEKYDKETNHSKDLEGQKRWDVYFDSQLKDS